MAKIGRKILDLRNCNKLLIHFPPFWRLAWKVLMEFASIDMKVHKLALVALQQVTEIPLTQFLEDVYEFYQHERRTILYPIDIAVTIRSCYPVLRLLRNSLQRRLLTQRAHRKKGTSEERKYCSN